MSREFVDLLEDWKMKKDKILCPSCTSITKQEYRELYERVETFAKLSGRVEAFSEFAKSEIKEGHTMIDIKSCAAILGFEVVDNAGK